MKRRTLLRGLTGGIVMVPSVSTANASSSPATEEKTKLLELFITFEVGGQSRLNGDLERADVDELLEYKLDEKRKLLRVYDPISVAFAGPSIGSVATHSNRKINDLRFERLLPIELTDRGRTTEAVSLANPVNGPTVDVTIRDSSARVEVGDTLYSIPNDESITYRGKRQEADAKTIEILDEKVDSPIPAQKRSLETSERVESIAVRPVVTIKNHGEVSVQYRR